MPSGKSRTLYWRNDVYDTLEREARRLTKETGRRVSITEMADRMVRSGLNLRRIPIVENGGEQDSGQ